MEKVCVAPGEGGSFQNWKGDLFLEEKAFPEKFPYGCGGYLSSMIDNDDNSMGFASYCVDQIMSCDPKFRQDSSYLFFLLLVKELIQLKRCKSTYFRQATRLPNMSKADIINVDPENLSRYNRSYQVFKNVRGTSMYYEEAKKNLMALLRQNGSPSAFLTLSCAEFDWPELLKEIVETVERREVTMEYVQNLPDKVKNKLISENVVQSTLHFQKRVDKLFSLMKHKFFKGSTHTYHVSSYFYRVEFQQRGAPHIHSLLWMKNENEEDAPNFCFTPTAENEEQNDKNTDQAKAGTGPDVSKSNEQIQQRIDEIQDFADFLISTNPDTIRCNEHESKTDNIPGCEACQILRDKVIKYQTHRHTFTCAKKKKTITIRENEGHGRLPAFRKPGE